MKYLRPRTRRDQLCLGYSWSWTRRSW